MKLVSDHDVQRVFLDTNVVLDYLLERIPFYCDAQRIWVSCEDCRVVGYISALTVNTVYYVARKLKGEDVAMMAVRELLKLFKVVPLDKNVLMRAADAHTRDYEDDVQLQSAITAGCECLYTRDAAHFSSEAIAILPPSTFENN